MKLKIILSTICVIVLMGGGCGVGNNINNNEKDIEEKKSYSNSDFSFRYPKEWGEIQTFESYATFQSNSEWYPIRFSNGEGIGEEPSPLPVLDIFTPDYKLSPPYPGEDQTTEVDYVHIDIDQDEKTIAENMKTPVILQADVTKVDIAGKKALFVKQKGYYWGSNFERVLYIFPKYNKLAHTLVISVSADKLDKLEELITELRFQ